MKKVFILFVCAAFLFSGCAEQTGDPASVTSEVSETEETGVSLSAISERAVVGRVYNAMELLAYSSLLYGDQIYTSTHTYTVSNPAKLSAKDALGKELASVAGNHEIYWSTDGEDLAEVTSEWTLYQVKGYDESFRVAIYYETGETAKETTYCLKIFGNLNCITLHEGGELFEDLLHLSDAASVTGTAGQDAEEQDLTGSAVVEEFLTAICESTELTSLQDAEIEWDADEVYTLSFSDPYGITTDIMTYEDGYAVVEFYAGTGLVVKIDEGIYEKIVKTAAKESEK